MPHPKHAYSFGGIHVGILFPAFCFQAVRGPERFRGGCVFGGPVISHNHKALSHLKVLTVNCGRIGKESILILSFPFLLTIFFDRVRARVPLGLDLCDALIRRNSDMNAKIPPQVTVSPTGMRRGKLYLYGLILIVVWGTAFNMITVGVRYISPIWLVAFRCCFAAVLLAAYTILRGHKFPPLRDSRWLWYFGLAMTGIVVPFFFTATGQQTIDSGIAAILVGAMPLITIVLAHFFADERMTLRKTFGFFIGFCGIVILFMPKNFSLGLIADWRAQTLFLLAAFCYAVTTVAAKRAPETPASLGAAIMAVCAAVSSLIWAMTTGMPDVASVPVMGWLMVAGLAIGSTAVGTILYLQVITEAGPTALARINYFPPVAAVIFGSLFLKEAFTLKMAAAFVVIIIGVLISRSGTDASEGS